MNLRYNSMVMSDKRPKLSKHTDAVVQAKLAGRSNVDIARELEISDERVRQIWLFYVRRTVKQSVAS
jgi:DNA-binding NarL/FixJ family response regulator